MAILFVKCISCLKAKKCDWSLFGAHLEGNEFITRRLNEVSSWTRRLALFGFSRSVSLIPMPTCAPPLSYTFKTCFRRPRTAILSKVSADATIMDENFLELKFIKFRFSVQVQRRQDLETFGTTWTPRRFKPPAATRHAAIRATPSWSSGPGHSHRQGQAVTGSRWPSSPASL